MKTLACLGLAACLTACPPRHVVHRGVAPDAEDAGAPADAGTAHSGAAGGTHDASAPPDAPAPPEIQPPPVAPTPVEPPRVDAAAGEPAVAPPPASACPAPLTPDEVIATFEGNQATTSVVGPRGGTPWNFLPADGSGRVMAMPIPERCGSRSALRVSGAAASPATRPLTQALLMTGGPGGVRFFDATGYTGLRLSLRSSVPGTVRLKVADRDTAQPGGICTMCNDHFATDLAVGTDWRSFTVPWTALRQQGIGNQFPALDVAHLFAIELFPPAASGAFDLWIDDVGFVR